MDRRKRILVVDDEAPIRRVLELKLKNGGYEVFLAEDGEAALRIIESEEPDAMVTDINMPRMNGKQLCAMTNRLKTERTFLTIIMTARIIPDDEHWITAMQDTVFMEKPFSPSSILERIDQYFGVKR
ncbi:MAG: response regulator [Syntrophales bacterium]|nr:response regulator [Syntrophales bacterium]